MPQEVITPEMAAIHTQYEKEVEQWGETRTIWGKAIIIALSFAVPLWTASYMLSSGTGPVNQAAWFSAATIFSFCGALAATVVIIVLFSLWSLTPAPKPPRYSKNIKQERQDY